jgi:hypothetical protein
MIGGNLGLQSGSQLPWAASDGAVKKHWMNASGFPFPGP